jgi:hypothetical protein
VGEPVAVRLEHVDAVLLRVAHLDVLEHEAVGAVRANGHVLLRPYAVRAAVPLRRVTRVDDDVVRVHA